jgi:hypothetical protein
MCRGPAQKVQASTIQPDLAQEQGPWQSEYGSFAEAGEAGQVIVHQCPPEMLSVDQGGMGKVAIHQCPPEMMVSDVAYPSHGCYYLNNYQPTQSWITVDGVNFVPVVLCSWPQDCGQLEQAIPQDQANDCAPLGDVWILSRDAKGCRQVQQAFDESSSDEERLALATQFVGRVWAALKCPHANHVIQKCISTIRPVDVQFIIDELREVAAGGVAQAARHRYGCRIIQRLLEHCAVEQVTPMVNDLLADAASLSSHIYGNYVIQHMLEFCTPDVVSHLTSILEVHVPSMALNDYSGAVVGKALCQAQNERRYLLAHTLLQQPEHLAAMSCSRRGQLAVKEALQLAEVTARNKACDELESRFGRLKACRYGRAVAKFVEDLQKCSAGSVN